VIKRQCSEKCPECRVGITSMGADLARGSASKQTAGVLRPFIEETGQHLWGGLCKPAAYN